MKNDNFERYLMRCSIAGLVALLLAHELWGATTISITRDGASACQCQKADGSQISAHTSAPQAYEACTNAAIATPGTATRVVCRDLILARVTNPTPAPAPTGALTINWNAPTKNTDGSALTVAGYEIAYGTSTASLTNTLAIAPDKLTHTLTGLTVGQTIYVAMRAKNSANEWSNQTNIASGVAQ